MPRARSRRSSSVGVRLALELADELARLRRVAFDQAVGELELHGERDELLLRAVVDVALEPAPLLVLRGDQSLLRGLQVVQPGLQLLGQPNVAQHESGLRREIGDQLLVRRRDGIARRLAHGERAEQLARLLDRIHAVHALDLRASTRSEAGSPSGRALRWARPRRRGALGRRRATRRRARHRCPRPGSAPSAAARPRRRTRRRRRSENSDRTSYGVARFAVHEPVREPRQHALAPAGTSRPRSRPRPS